jgi:hypothetical protein
MDHVALRRRRRAEWWRLGAGLLGGLLNAFGMVVTAVGVLAQSIRDHEDGSEFAGAYHLAHLAFNATALYFLLARLADERFDARVTVGAWTVATAAVWLAYWSWAI